jgi:anti-sigma factor RsiW
MSHPDLDRLTAWVHGMQEPAEAHETQDHVAACAECREVVEGLREEARLISREILPAGRADELKERILQAAGRRPRRWRGWLWQVPAAAAVLIGLLTLLSSQAGRHHLVDGRVALPDGSVAAAPLDLDGSLSWQLRALEKARVELRDRTTVELTKGARLALTPVGPRGVQPAVSSGEALFIVVNDLKPLTIELPAGRVVASDGTLTVKFVVQEKGEDPMNKTLAGALVTLVAGSASLSTPNGVAEARAGQSAILAPAEAPLLVASPQDKQEDLLRRLEELVARVAKLEAEVSQLEARNKQLKVQLQSNAPGGPGGSVWVVEGNGAQLNPGPGGSVQRVLHVTIDEKDEKTEKKPEKKAPSEK